MALWSECCRALVHDVVITLGILAFLHVLGVPVVINLPAVGAIMTLIGYSLNDTIIVFDRLREKLRINRRGHMREAVNHALNVTLGRTVMTSGTTLLAVAPLAFFGGEAVFTFGRDHGDSACSLERSRRSSWPPPW